MRAAGGWLSGYRAFTEEMLAPAGTAFRAFFRRSPAPGSMWRPCATAWSTPPSPARSNTASHVRHSASRSLDTKAGVGPRESQCRRSKSPSCLQGGARWMSAPYTAHRCPSQDRRHRYGGPGDPRTHAGDGRRGARQPGAVLLVSDGNPDRHPGGRLDGDASRPRRPSDHRIPYDRLPQTTVPSTRAIMRPVRRTRSPSPCARPARRSPLVSWRRAEPGGARLPKPRGWRW